MDIKVKNSQNPKKLLVFPNGQRAIVPASGIEIDVKQGNPVEFMVTPDTELKDVSVEKGKKGVQVKIKNNKFKI